jgi:hypothetical protein
MKTRKMLYSPFILIGQAYIPTCDFFHLVYNVNIGIDVLDSGIKRVYSDETG